LDEFNYMGARKRAEVLQMALVQLEYRVMKFLPFVLLLSSACGTTDANPIGIRTDMNINILPTQWQYDADMVDWVYVKVLDEMLGRNLITKQISDAMILRANEVNVRFVTGTIDCGISRTVGGCYYPSDDLVEVSTILLPAAEQSLPKKDEQVYCTLNHEFLHFILTKMGEKHKSATHDPLYFGDGGVTKAVCRDIWFSPR